MSVNPEYDALLRIYDKPTDRKTVRDKNQLRQRENWMHWAKEIWADSVLEEESLETLAERLNCSKHMAMQLDSSMRIIHQLPPRKKPGGISKSRRVAAENFFEGL